MPINKLEKFEEALVKFKVRYDDLEAESDGLRAEVKDLKMVNCALVQRKKEIKEKVESLLDLLKGLGL